MRQLSKLLLILLFPCISVLKAQNTDFKIPDNADYSLTGYNQHASLMGWSQRMEIQLLDRSNNPYGLVSDRGWMFNYGKYISDEFSINRMTYLPTLSEDYIWYRSPNALRTVIGDYDDLNVITFNEMRFQVEIKPKHTLEVYGYTEKNPIFNRAFFNLNYQFQIKDNIKVGLRHTIGSSKVDMDASVFAQMGNSQTGYLKAEVTAVDYLNNISSNNAVENGFYSDTVRIYDTFPAMLSVSAVSPEFKSFRGEMFFTFHTNATSTISSLVSPNEKFLYSHSGFFGGALLEYKLTYFTVGSVFKILKSTSSRDSSGTSVLSPSYKNEQLEMHKGFYLLANASQITWDSWIWLVDYTELQDGGTYDVLADVGRDFEQTEKRFFMHNRIYVHPDYNGLLFGIEHLADLRSKHAIIPNNNGEFLVPDNFDPLAAVYPKYFHDSNNRLLFVAGYQFHPRAIVQIGYGMDLDKDLHRTVNGQGYDTAFLRLDLRW